MVRLSLALCFAASASKVCQDPNASGSCDDALSKHFGEVSLSDEQVPVSPNTPDRRLIDPVPSVRPEHAGGRNPLNVSEVEWQARVDAAAAYRALKLHGMGDDLAAQCVMVRIPGREEYLLGEWGLFFHEQTASSMLKYDFQGNIINLDGSKELASPGRSNMGCLPVASAIMTSRPDVHCIIHIHPYSVMAVGGLKTGLLPLSQAAFFLYGQVSREGYDFTYENSFEDALIQGFANGQRAMLLNHHGMYAVGRDAAEGFFVAKHLTQACDVQVKTLSMAGGDLSKVILPEFPQLRRQYKDMMLSPDYAYDGSREWPGVIRELKLKLPGFNL
jgi:ribulose-5-phosphate 4-epimerase/fuculose-1-phosphate aldolase